MTSCCEWVGLLKASKKKKEKKTEGWVERSEKNSNGEN